MCQCYLDSSRPKNGHTGKILWDCCNCGYNGMNVRLYSSCINCGHYRCDGGPRSAPSWDLQCNYAAVDDQSEHMPAIPTTGMPSSSNKEESPRFGDSTSPNKRIEFPKPSYASLPRRTGKEMELPRGGEEDNLGSGCNNIADSGPTESFDTLELEQIDPKTTARIPAATDSLEDHFGESNSDDDEVSSVISDSTGTLSGLSIVGTPPEDPLEQPWIHHRVRNFFHGVFQQWWGTRERTGNYDPEHSTSSTQDHSTSSGSVSSGNGTKRKDHADSGTENHQRNGLRTSKRVRNRNSPRASLEFACPFCKKSLQQYQSCATWGTPKISWVKQHVIRKHMNEINETQRAQLSRRSTHGSSDEARWYEVFGIVFPQHLPLPQSPYRDFIISSQPEVSIDEVPLIPRRYLENDAVDILERTILEDPNVFHEEGEFSAANLRTALRRGMALVTEGLTMGSRRQNSSLSALPDPSERTLEGNNQRGPMVSNDRDNGHNHLIHAASHLRESDTSSTVRESIENPDVNNFHNLEGSGPSIHESFPNLVNEESDVGVHDPYFLDDTFDREGYFHVPQDGQDGDENTSAAEECTDWDHLAILDLCADRLLSPGDFF